MVEDRLNHLKFNVISPTLSRLWSDTAAAGGIHAQLNNLQTRSKKGQDQEQTIKQNVIHNLGGLISTFNIPGSAVSPGRNNLRQDPGQ